MWLLNPLLRTLEVFGLERARWTLDAVHAGDDAVRAPPFDAVALALARLWER